MLWISCAEHPTIRTTRQKMSGPDSSNGLSIRYESDDWGLDSPSGRDIFCLKKVWHFYNGIRSCVLNECTINILNVNFTLNKVIVWTIISVKMFELTLLSVGWKNAPVPLNIFSSVSWNENEDLVIFYILIQILIRIAFKITFKLFHYNPHFHTSWSPVISHDRYITVRCSAHCRVL